MIRSVLVPLDGSAFGEQVLPHAALIANRSGAHLHLAHVLTPVVFADPMMQYTALDVETPRDAQTYLSDLKLRLPDLAKSSPLSTVVLDGPVTDALAKYAEDGSIDLIVMASHGHGPLARAWMGSVSDELLRGVPTPILLVRTKGTAEPEAVAPAIAIQHVVVALDGTAESEAILAPAVQVARCFGARISILRVAIPGWPNSRNDLQRAAEELRKQGLDVQTLEVEHDDPATAIVAEVSKHQGDLIAMATHARSGLTRLFLGSVTDRVVRESNCPVLVVNASNATFSEGETMSSDELVVVYKAPDAMLARVIAAELTNEGMQCAVSGENQAGYTGIQAVGVEVLVHAADAERARKIIEEHERSHAGDEEQAETT